MPRRLEDRRRDLGRVTAVLGVILAVLEFHDVFSLVDFAAVVFIVACLRYIWLSIALYRKR